MSGQKPPSPPHSTSSQQQRSKPDAKAATSNQNHTELADTFFHKQPLLRTLYCWLPPVACMGVIFFLSAQPVLPGPNVIALDFLFKKSAHIIAYGVLYVAFYRAFTLTYPKKSPTIQAVLPAVCTILYACSDEWHQTFVPGRGGTIRDVGFDSLGVLIAFLKLYRYI